ncbi:MAG: hypothetical protein WB586_26130, partial [Chthoniobacterales bacterium]
FLLSSENRAMKNELFWRRADAFNVLPAYINNQQRFAERNGKGLAMPAWIAHSTAEPQPT